MSVLTDPQDLSIKKIFIASVDGLMAFPMQLVTDKNKIYNLISLADKWDDKYRKISQSWIAY